MGYVDFVNEDRFDEMEELTKSLFGKDFFNTDNICDYDEGYTRADAYEIGWCHKCNCNPNCPYKKKTKSKK